MTRLFLIRICCYGFMLHSSHLNFKMRFLACTQFAYVLNIVDMLLLLHAFASAPTFVSIYLSIIIIIIIVIIIMGATPRLLDALAPATPLTSNMYVAMAPSTTRTRS